MNKIKEELSRIRNPGIAEAFLYMTIIESWGSGIPRILREAKQYGLKEPELLDMGMNFRINLFRRPFEVDEHGVANPLMSMGNRGENADDVENVVDDVENVVKKILSAIKRDSSVSARELAETIGMSVRQVQRILSKLKNEKVIEHSGPDKGGLWHVIRWKTE